MPSNTTFDSTLCYIRQDALPPSNRISSVSGAFFCAGFYVFILLVSFHPLTGLVYLLRRGGAVIQRPPYPPLNKMGLVRFTDPFLGESQNLATGTAPCGLLRRHGSVRGRGLYPAPRPGCIDESSGSRVSTDLSMCAPRSAQWFDHRPGLNIGLAGAAIAHEPIMRAGCEPLERPPLFARHALVMIADVGVEVVLRWGVHGRFESPHGVALDAQPMRLAIRHERIQRLRIAARGTGLVLVFMHGVAGYHGAQKKPGVFSAGFVSMSRRQRIMDFFIGRVALSCLDMPTLSHPAAALSRHLWGAA